MARKLSCDLDIIFATKLRASANEKQVIGAVMLDGTCYTDSGLINSLGITDQYLQEEKTRCRKQMNHISKLLPGKQSQKYKINDKIVILVDDGAVTGSTIITAARWIRKHDPKHLTIAIPVAPKEILKLLEREADEVEVISTPRRLTTLKEFYEELDPVTYERIAEVMGNRA